MLFNRIILLLIFLQHIINVQIRLMDYHILFCNYIHTNTAAVMRVILNGEHA